MRAMMRSPPRWLPRHEHAVLCLSWLSPTVLVSVAWGERVVRRWDLARGEESWRIELEADALHAAMIPGRGEVAVAQPGGALCVYDATSGAIHARATIPGTIYDLAAAADGTSLYACTRVPDWSLWRWRLDAESEALVEGITQFEYDASLAVARDGSAVWAFFEWDVLRVGRGAREAERVHRDRGRCFGPGVALAGGDEVIEKRWRLNHDDEPVSAEVIRWTPQTDARRWGQPEAGDGPIALTFDERLVAVASFDRVTCYATADGRVTGSWRIPKGKVLAMAFSPDDARLAVGTNRGDVAVFERGEWGG